MLALLAVLGCGEPAERTGRPDVDASAAPAMSRFRDAGVADASRAYLDAENGADPDASEDTDGAEVEASADTMRTLAPTTVKVSGGWVEGRLGGDVQGFAFTTRRFLGIPFAAPPQGELRFAAPRPAAPWAGTKLAHAFGPSCHGIALKPPAEGMSEDCLTLNVFTPARLPPEPLPVMVYLFGGGFQTGSAATEAQWLAERDVVVVVPNYRVGALGFMAHPALDAALETTSGNMGLRDQRLSLEWVRDNIAAFGGDPRRVTLFGESAGAISTCLHMLMPESRGLAHAFIMESGACVAGTGRPRGREAAFAAGQSLAEALCPGTASDALVSCLRARPAGDFSSVLTPGVLAASYWPYVDGDLLPADARQLAEHGALRDLPFIVGSNLNERRFFDDVVVPTVFERASFELSVRLQYPEAADAILAHYAPATDADAYRVWVRLWTDEYFRCPARLLSRIASERGRRAYLYSFEVPPAVHSQDLDYVFAWPCCGVSSRYPGVAPEPLLPGVVNAMQRYWTNLARAGEPNAPGLVGWPAYDATKPYLRLRDPVSVGHALADADCDFWDEIYQAQVK